MRWEHTSAGLLLIDDNDIVVAKDIGENKIIPIDDGLTKDEFIQKCEEWWDDFIDELDANDCDEDED